MGISEDLMELLVCPECKGALEEAGDGSTLDCCACGLSFPIVDDIPVLLAEEAAPLNTATNG